MTSGNQYDASGSLAGYLYQCRLALLIGLQTLKRKPNGQISVEKFDDIAFGSENYADCIIQAKHHITAKLLTDSSVDVWKTIRIWVDGFKAGSIANAEIRRLLITTAVAPEGAAMARLRRIDSKADRDISAARKSLQEVAKTSTNKTTEPARLAFLSLNDAEAELLLKSVEVIDGSASLPDVMSEIEGELVLLAPSHVEKIAEALEGWWLKIIARRLVGHENAEIPLQDIIRKASELGSSYGPDRLPVTAPEELGDKPYDPADEAETYVRQMRLVGLAEGVIKRGVRDYYRASSQRSKWARESLLLDGEATRYDAKLRDLWERRFDAECGELAGADHEKTRLVGRQIFGWANQLQVDFRNVVEAWITAGSFHGLADRLEVGWHPEYLTHLSDDGGGSGKA